jgi:stage II sporulation protein D
VTRFLLVVVALCLPCVAQAAPIRVQILNHQLDAVISSDGGLIVRDPDSGSNNPLFAPDVTTVLGIQPQAAGLMIAGTPQSASRILVTPLTLAPLYLGGRPYRGAMIVRRNNDGTLDVIDQLDVEEYLYGVVAAEMSPDWPQIALQVQAIASRSFAVARARDAEYDGYDVKAGEQDQAYAGSAFETQSSVNAVDATRGVVIVYNDHIVKAYYSACDGGYTADGSALEDPEPYLQAVPDPYASGSPNLAWRARVLLADFSAALRASVGDVGDVTAIRPGPADASGRLLSVSIAGTGGSRTVAGTLFRKLVGTHVIKSTRINAIEVDGDSLQVSGSGYGHGVGMSQWGVKGMADRGLGIYQILGFYYRGTMLSKI